MSFVGGDFYARGSSQTSYARALRVFASGLALTVVSMFSACTSGAPECPIDDGDPCTLDECKAGVPVNDYLGDGHPCFLGRLQGACSQGRCAISCDWDSQCNDGLPCTRSRCQDGFCAVEPDDSQAAPEDGNACTEEHCVGGAVVSWQKVDGTPCGNFECESGMCVQCSKPADCGTNTECRTWSCDHGYCVAKNLPAMTPVLVGAVKWDCKQNVCDGHGAVVEVAFAEDIPADYDQCFSWKCIGMTPLREPNIAKGCLMNDGGIGYCNPEGTCVQCVQDMNCGDGYGCVENKCRKCGSTDGQSPELCGGSCGSCIGLECKEDSDCASGHCVGTNAVPPHPSKRCCESACDGVCQQCSTNGTCEPVPNGKLDGDTCYFPNMACAGTKCLYTTGHWCNDGNDCVSGVCINMACK